MGFKFTGNDPGVRKSLVLLLGLFSFGAWRQRRAAKRAKRDAEKITEQDKERDA